MKNRMRRREPERRNSQDSRKRLGRDNQKNPDNIKERINKKRKQRKSTSLRSSMRFKVIKISSSSDLKALILIRSSKIYKKRKFSKISINFESKHHLNILQKSPNLSLKFQQNLSLILINSLLLTLRKKRLWSSPSSKTWLWSQQKPLPKNTKRKRHNQNQKKQNLIHHLQLQKENR